MRDFHNANLLDSDGTGVANLRGDYSAAGATRALFIAEDDIVIGRLLPFVLDTGSADLGKYGALSALSVGIEIKIWDVDDVVLQDLTLGLPMKINAHFARLGYDGEIVRESGNTVVAHARWTYWKAGTSLFPTGLLIRAGQKFGITLGDNLEGLVEHYWQFQGSHPSHSLAHNS